MTKGAIFSLFCPALSSVPNHYLSVIARGSGLTLAPSLSIEAKPGGRGTDIAMFKQQISTNRNLKRKQTIITTIITPIPDVTPYIISIRFSQTGF